MPIPFSRTILFLAAACALAAAPRPSAAQAGCPTAANAQVNAGWTRYRAGDFAAAEREFAAALRRCPAHPGGRTGLGYAALQQGRLPEARRRFEEVLAGAPDDVDAAVGLGLAAWRAGDVEAARTAFTRVQRLDPANEEARTHLARMPQAGQGAAAAAPPRPPLVLPDTVVYPARARGDRFEVRTARGWEPFYVKGVNIGAALPGKYASEFPDSATYARWLEQIGAMGANTVRVYTMHPPHFYRALRAHNLAHPGAPLWLIHGVWAELPPGEDYDHPEWEREFFGDVHFVVDIVHGRADVPVRPGRSSGRYTADVSPWTLGYIIGREWESHSVAHYVSLPGKRSGWRGRYLRVEGGNPMDAWMGKACEEVIAYEMRTYRAQRPVAYTNWPTTDPLAHPTESTIMEEAGIRRALGEAVNIRPVLEGDDAVALDPSLVRATAEFPAGYYASYHVYPYYPDFMVLDPGYNRARSPWGPSSYWGYLTDLKEHHSDLPVLISEYGVPASIGMAHLHPQGWHHGGNPEPLMAEVNARLTREVAAARMAGGVFFEWIDEWFKKTWNTTEFEVPLDRDRLWHNRMDAEEHYGVLAMEPRERLAGAGAAERLASWRRLPALYSTPDGARLRALADEAYLRLLFEPGSRPADELLLGFDLVRPDAGDFRWPGGAGERLPVGIELALRVTRDEARLLADTHSNPTRVVPSGQGMRGGPVAAPEIGRRPPGFFRGRFMRMLSLPLVTRPNEDGVYDSLRVLTSRSRYGRDTTEYGALGYDWGILPRGPLPDGLWERLDARGTVEVRIPWQLLGVTDPSRRLVLQDTARFQREGEGNELGTVRVDAIRIVAAARDAAGWRSFPAGGRAADAASFTWPGWEEPEWRARPRPVYDALRDAWRTLDAPVLRQP